MSEKFVPVELVFNSKALAHFAHDGLTVINAKSDLPDLESALFVANKAFANGAYAVGQTLHDYFTIVLVRPMNLASMAAFCDSPNRFAILSSSQFHSSSLICGGQTTEGLLVKSFLENAFFALPAARGDTDITVTDCARALGLPIVDGAYRYEVNGL